MTRGETLRAVGSGIAGALLLLLASALAFLRPQVGAVLVELDPRWLQVTSWAGLRVVAWAALAGGAWLVAVAWRAWRGAGDDEEPTAA